MGDDLRAYQHGVDFLKKKDGTYYLVWASSGNPPTGPLKNNDWTHDIYYATINPHHPEIVLPIKIISQDEAQEPASSAIAEDGAIMITMEDGWQGKHNVAQRYGLYDRNFKAIKPYPRLVHDGGHSGHVAAVGNQFVVFYSQGWVRGGGVDELGSGDDVLLKTYSSKGEYQARLDVAVGEETRDWWPMIAGSNKVALLVWQRFLEDKAYAELMFGLYDPNTNTITHGNKPLAARLTYYNYDVQYVDSIERFIVTGTNHDGGGFAYLLSEKGEVTAEHHALAAFVREAQPAICNQDGRAIVVYPAAPNKLQILELGQAKISSKRELEKIVRWGYIGTDGIFIDENTLYFISLSQKGLVEKTVLLPAGCPPY